MNAYIFLEGADVVGAASATNPLQIGGQDAGGLVRAARVDSSGNVQIGATALPLPTGAATSVAQASTTSGETGPLVQGATSTSAPSYATAKTNPLSLTLAGALRVDGSAVTQPVSIATQPALVAGAAIIGKVGIDQTTPGTTNLVQDAADGPVSAGTVAGKSMLAGMQYNSSLPSPTTGQQLAWQCDGNGRGRVNPHGTIAVVSVANPGAGAVWTYTVPTGTIIRIISLRFAFNASAVAATRQVYLQAGSPSNIFGLPYQRQITASQSAFFYAGSGAVPADYVDVNGSVWSNIVMPGDFILSGGQTINVACANMQSADAFNGIAIQVESWTL
jgi:hypothetical protein